MSTAVQKAAPLAKEALKQGISNAANFGSEKAIQGIQKLAEKSINYGAPESLTHSLAKAAEQGTKAAVKESTKALNSSLAHIVPTSTSSTPKPRPRPVPLSGRGGSNWRLFAAALERVTLPPSCVGLGSSVSSPLAVLKMLK